MTERTIPGERNRFPAHVKDVRAGSAIDRIRVQVGDLEIESLMTHQDAEKLHLRPGDSVMVVLKATSVVIQRPRNRATTPPPPRASKAAHAA